MSAVGALPNAVAFAREDHVVVDVFQKFAVAFLVRFFDGSHHFKLSGNFFEAFFACFFCEGGIHVRPLVVFSVGSVSEVHGCFGHCSAVEILEPQFGVFFFVLGGFGEDV